LDNPAAARIPGEFRDIVARIPDWRPHTILDVGANIGQSCLSYAAAFPEARIHAFEPVPETFASLQANTAGTPTITAHHVAVGAEPGVARMITKGTSTTARIMQDAPDRPGIIEVPVEPGAAIWHRLGLDTVSFLKVDTEGHDLEVLHGFAPVLRRIQFVQVEASMNAYNTRHVPFRVLEDTLRAFGFLLFRFYDQAMEGWRGGRPVLRRTNPLFIHGSLVDLAGYR